MQYMPESSFAYFSQFVLQCVAIDFRKIAYLSFNNEKRTKIMNLYRNIRVMSIEPARVAYRPIFAKLVQSRDIRATVFASFENNARISCNAIKKAEDREYFTEKANDSPQIVRCFTSTSRQL